MKKYFPAFAAILILGFFLGAVIVKWQSRKQTVGQNITAEITITASPSAPLIPTQTETAAPPSEPSVSTSPQILLTITSPLPDSTVYTPTISVRGKTVPRAEVSVNEKDTTADSSGNFSATLTLDEGENTIFITAVDDEGNSAETELIVTYEPEDEE